MNISECKFALRKDNKGFSLIEMIVVLGIAVLLGAAALPSYMAWQERIAYRTTARNLSNMLREGRSLAIMKSLQHRVDFGSAPISTKFRLLRSTDPVTNATWATVQDWVSVDGKVRVNASNLDASNSIIFYPNGTATFAGLVNSSTINIQDNTGGIRYVITVSNIGKISVQ